MITLTESATKALRRFIRFSEEPVIGLRVGVTAGGCAGFQYEIALTGEQNDDDTVIEAEGMKIYLDPQSAGLVQDMTIDFKDTMLESGFVYHNPNATGSCGCGKSFSV
ncbi:HesB/IscA family protein [Endothiovibrio diazotrophicus]